MRNKKWIVIGAITAVVAATGLVLHGLLKNCYDEDEFFGDDYDDDDESKFDDDLEDEFED